MAAKIYYQEDCNLSLLEGQKIAIIGLTAWGEIKPFSAAAKML